MPKKTSEIMNILITGSKGQLGNEMQLAAVRYPQFGYIFTDIDELIFATKPLSNLL